VSNNRQGARVPKDWKQGAELSDRAGRRPAGHRHLALDSPLSLAAASEVYLAAGVTPEVIAVIFSADRRGHELSKGFARAPSLAHHRQVSQRNTRKRKDHPRHFSKMGSPNCWSNLQSHRYVSVASMLVAISEDEDGEDPSPEMGNATARAQSVHWGFSKVRQCQGDGEDPSPEMGNATAWRGVFIGALRRRRQVQDIGEDSSPALGNATAWRNADFYDNPNDNDYYNDDDRQTIHLGWDNVLILLGVMGLSFNVLYAGTSMCKRTSSFLQTHKVVIHPSFAESTASSMCVCPVVLSQKDSSPFSDKAASDVMQGESFSLPNQGVWAFRVMCQLLCTSSCARTRHSHTSRAFSRHRGNRPTPIPLQGTHPKNHYSNNNDHPTSVLHSPVSG